MTTMQSGATRQAGGGAAAGSGAAGGSVWTTWPPLFERLLYYMFIPEIFARVVLEAGLNLYWYSLIQPKLWVFYGLVLIELCCQVVTLGRTRLRLRFGLIPFFLLATMAFHGLVLGLAWGNNPGKVLTDTIPILVAAGNTLLLNRAGTLDGFSFARLRRVTLVYSVVMVWVGVAAVAAGRLSVVSLGGAAGQPVCLTILLVHLAAKKRVGVGDLALIALIVGPSVPNINRTTLAVFLIVFLILIVPRVLAAGRQIYFSAILVAAVATAFIGFVPADSPLMRRIEATIERVSSQRDEQSGSLYERQAEWAAINEKLRALGPTAEWFGYGAGGIYQVELTGGNIPPNYSHAHYSWALFRLRFGNVGFLYLAFFAACLLGNLAKASRARDAQGRIVLIFDVWCLVFLFTYAFFNFLIAGLQFADTRPGPERGLRAAVPRRVRLAGQLS